jgi:sialidase-1
LGEDHESEIINGQSKDTRRVFVLSSSDDGKTWSTPKEITSSTKEPNWTWYATGPCHGIQLKNSKYKGRLVVPCDHIETATKKYYSHIIYSDDHGNSWKLGGTTPSHQVNECTVAEFNNGKLILNMRNYDYIHKNRKISLSSNGGESWGNLFSDSMLVEPICQASLLAINGGKTLYFSNPSSKISRSNMQLKVSFNEGRSWEVETILFAGPAAYSDLAQISNGSIACLFEAGWKNPYEGIVFKIVPLEP